jgi:hypothetical protein
MSKAPLLHTDNLVYQARTAECELDISSQPGEFSKLVDGMHDASV